MTEAMPRPSREPHFPNAVAGPTASEPNPEFSRPAAQDRVRRAAEALRANGFTVVVAETRPAAVEAVLERIPDGSKVMDASSATLAALGLDTTLRSSPRFSSAREEFGRLYAQGKASDARKVGSAPDVVVGSVHAITETGQVVIASATGSQLAPYVYGADRVVWVVGSQKIVPDIDTAFRRIEEYTYPLEDARARKVYGQGSTIAKVLVVNREVQPDRITIVILSEALGF